MAQWTYRFNDTLVVFSAKGLHESVEAWLLLRVHKFFVNLVSPLIVELLKVSGLLIVLVRFAVLLRIYVIVEVLGGSPFLISAVRVAVVWVALVFVLLPVVGFAEETCLLGTFAGCWVRFAFLLAGDGAARLVWVTCLAIVLGLVGALVRGAELILRHLFPKFRN